MQKGVKLRVEKILHLNTIQGFLHHGRGVQPIKAIIEWEFQPPEPVKNRCVGTICPLSRGPIFLDGNHSSNVLSTVSPPPGSIQTKDVYKIIRQKGAKRI